ncbi:MAG: four helix bundle protein, partial [Candidatus Gracilibacteria bacterium]|nr:four helix bundle protein [Candidatus Gracilibacteria bacterium]
MFDHEKLIAYQKAKETNCKMQRLLGGDKKISNFLKDQLHRAAISMVINIAEGAGRIGKKDRRRFYVISRSSCYECASIIDVLYGMNMIEERFFIDLKTDLEEVSKLLYGLIRRLDQVQVGGRGFLHCDWDLLTCTGFCLCYQVRVQVGGRGFL